MCLAMPHGIESSDGGYKWDGNETDEMFIEVNFEPSGARLPRDEWAEWLELFKQRASEVIGYGVGESEDGEKFVSYEMKPRGLLSPLKSRFIQRLS